MGRQYYGTAVSEANVTWRVELHSTAAATDIELTIKEPFIEYNEQGKYFYESTILSSRASCQFVMRNTTDFNTFVAMHSDSEDEWKLVIYKNSSLFWVGKVVLDQIQYLREDPSTGFALFEVMAVDGLATIDGYPMSDINFSIGDRQTIAYVIMSCIAKNGLSGFWTNSDTYMQDGSGLLDNANFGVGADLMDGTVSSLAFIKNFKEFKGLADVEYLSCKEGLEAILGAFGLQLLHTEGKYIVRLIAAHYAASYAIKNYAKNGNELSTGSYIYYYPVDTTNVRPKLLAHPIRDYQKPVRGVQVDFERMNGVFEYKTTSSTSVISATHDQIIATGSSPGRTIKVSFYYKLKYQNSVVKRWKLKYRVYAYNGSSYKYYVGGGINAWTTIGSIVTSTYEDYILDVPALYRTLYANYEGTNYFEYPEPPSGYTTVVAKFKIVEETATVVSKGAGGSVIVWTSPASTDHDFTGSVVVEQAYTSTDPIEYSQKRNFTSAFTGARANTSSLVKLNSLFYNGPDKDVGGVLVWNGSAYVEPGDWDAPWTSVVGDLPEIVANTWAGMYEDYRDRVKMTLYDSGSYTAGLVLAFDSLLWIFNGGRFSIDSETWDGEWVAAYYTGNYIANNGEGETTDGQNDNTNGRIVRLNEELERVKGVLGGIGSEVRADMINNGLGAPTSDPGSDRYYAVKMKYGYDSSNPTLDWQLIEKGEIVKSVDETASSDSTLSSDSELQFNMEASKIYYIEIMAFYSTGSTPQFKYGLTGPGTPTMVNVVRRHGNSTVTNGFDTSYTASTSITGMNNGFVEMKIMVQTGLTGGVFAFQWAQNTSDAGLTKVLAGSYLKYQKQ